MRVHHLKARPSRPGFFLRMSNAPPFEFACGCVGGIPSVARSTPPVWTAMTIKATLFALEFCVTSLGAGPLPTNLPHAQETQASHRQTTPAPKAPQPPATPSEATPPTTEPTQAVPPASAPTATAPASRPESEGSLPFSTRIAASSRSSSQRRNAAARSRSL